jgi:hypothetical protein
VEVMPVRSGDMHMPPAADALFSAETKFCWRLDPAQRRSQPRIPVLGYRREQRVRFLCKVMCRTVACVADANTFQKLRGAPKCCAIRVLGAPASTAEHRVFGGARARHRCAPHAPRRKSGMDIGPAARSADPEGPARTLSATIPWTDAHRYGPKPTFVSPGQLPAGDFFRAQPRAG